MGNKLIHRLPDLGNAREQFEVFDEFWNYNDGDLWTKLASDTNATVAHEGSSGATRVKLYTGDAIKNNEACFATTNEIFKYVANRGIELEGLVQFAESATDDAKVAWGIADAIGANLVTDAGAITANDAALIWKTEDSTVWRFHTECNGVQNKKYPGGSTAADASTISTTTAGGSAAQRLSISITPVSATIMRLVPKVDGVALVDSNNVPIVHHIAIASATEMDFGAYVKSGSGTSGQETLYVDYMYGAQVR